MARTEHAPSYEHLEYDTPLFRTAIAQFDQAVPHAAVDEGVAERLRHPERSIIVACPIKLDDGRELPLVKVETTSETHPFYTGTQKSVDSLGGRVEKFRNKFARVGLKK